MMYFYQRLRDLREDEDMTQAQAAELLGITRQQYQLYESGKREMPFNLIIEFADHFAVSIDYIAGRTSDKRGIGFCSYAGEEAQIIEKYRSLDRDRKNRVCGYLAALFEEMHN